MPMLDVFNGDGFSLMSMTAAINLLPEVPTLLGDLGIFEEAGIPTLTAVIEKFDEGLTLVQSSSRGGPGESVGGEARDLRNITIPHFQRDDAIMADEVMGVRSFGSENQLETVWDRVNLKLARHARSFDLTMENLRMGAINGLVLDKNGNTLLDIASLWGVSLPSAVNFNLDVSTTNVRDKCRQVLDGVEDACEGIRVPRVYGIAGDDFFNILVTHSAVEKTYANWNAAVTLRQDPRLPFEFGGISWIRYHTRPKAKAAKSNNKMVADGSCRFVATGVPELYITRFAPADYEETVNTIGLPRYAKQWQMDNNKGRNLEVQMNTISLCTRPGALYSATAT